MFEILSCVRQGDTLSPTHIITYTFLKKLKMVAQLLNEEKSQIMHNRKPKKRSNPIIFKIGNTVLK